MAVQLPGSVRLIAILNVVAWGGFWAFGYLALSSSTSDQASMATAMVLAVLGAGVGIWAYMVLVRASRMSGYEKPYKRASIAPSDSSSGEQPT